MGNYSLPYLLRSAYVIISSIPWSGRSQKDASASAAHLIREAPSRTFVQFLSLHTLRSHTVILHFLDVRRYGRKHMQLTLIKMHILAAGVTAFTVETRPGGLIFACYSVTCKFMLNAMILGGKQYDNYPRKNCLHKKVWCMFPSLSLPPPYFNRRGETSCRYFEPLHTEQPIPKGTIFPALPATHPQSELEPLVSSCNCIILQIKSRTF